MPGNTRLITATIIFGSISTALYVALLMNSNLLVELAERTRNGEKWLFLAPVFIAFLFSYVHGTFTGLFWESLGLKPAQNNGNKSK
jgi:hypothetical protein